MQLRDHGDAAAAVELLGGLLARDARCLDAHAHLGLLAFNAGEPHVALGHYATGVQIGERSPNESFNGVLPWGWVDNRPFLRCLHGLALSAWRLGEHDRAETLCWALLWLNPADNQGVSSLLPEIIAGHDRTGDRDRRAERVLGPASRRSASNCQHASAESSRASRKATSLGKTIAGSRASNGAGADGQRVRAPRRSERGPRISSDLVLANRRTSRPRRPVLLSRFRGCRARRPQLGSQATVA